LDIRNIWGDNGLPLFCRLGLILLLTTTGTWAADSLNVEANPDSALSVTLSQLPGSNISPNEAIALALTHATQVNEAKAAVKAARGAARSVKGAFDPGLFAQILKTDSHVPEAFLQRRSDQLIWLV